MKPVLSARGLDKRFGAVVAAAAITIDVPAGQKVSLIGVERRRQDHLRQHGDRLPQAGRRRDRARRRERRSALAPRRIAQRGHLPLVPDPAALRRADRARQHARRLRGVRAAAASFLLASPGGGRAAGAGRGAPPALRPRTLTPERPVTRARRAACASSSTSPWRSPASRGCCSSTSRPPGVGAEEKFPAMDRVMEAARGRGRDGALRRARHGDRRRPTPTGWSPSTAAGSSPTGAPAEVLRAAEVRRYVTGGRRMSGGALLEIDDLHVAIQSMEALRGFSLRVAPGAHGRRRRPQRRRQDDADAHRHGPSRAVARGRVALRGRGPRRRRPPMPARPSASATCRRTASSCRSSPSRRTSSCRPGSRGR